MKTKTAGIAAVVLVALLATTVASGMNFTGWATAQPVAELNTTSGDGCPIQSPDGLSFYLASTARAHSAASTSRSPHGGRRRSVVDTREPRRADQLGS